MQTESLGARSPGGDEQIEDSKNARGQIDRTPRAARGHQDADEITLARGYLEEMSRPQTARPPPRGITRTARPMPTDILRG